MVADFFIFVCHVSEDRDAALAVVDELERRGVGCWIAPRDVRPGRPFDDEIADAIDQCRALLLIFSDRCNERDYIRREVTVAGEAGRLVIPFRIENAQPKRGLRVRLSDLHWIDAFVARERAIDEVIREVGRVAGAAQGGRAVADREASETKQPVLADQGTNIATGQRPAAGPVAEKEQDRKDGDEPRAEAPIVEGVREEQRAAEIEYPPADSSVRSAGHEVEDEPSEQGEERARSEPQVQAPPSSVGGAEASPVAETIPRTALVDTPAAASSPVKVSVEVEPGIEPIQDAPAHFGSVEIETAAASSAASLATENVLAREPADKPALIASAPDLTEQPPGREADEAPGPREDETTKPNRRRLVLGLGGVAGLAVVGGGALWLAGTRHASEPSPAPSPTSSTTAPATPSTPASVPEPAPPSAPTSPLEAADSSIRTFTGHSGEINSVAFSADGRIALSGSDDGTAKLWEIATGKEIRTYGPPSSGSSLVEVAFMPDGHAVITADLFSKLNVWDLATGKLMRTLAVGMPGGRGALWSFALSPDGRTALVGLGIVDPGDEYRVLRLWDVGTTKLVRTFRQESGAVRSVSFSSDGRLALVGGNPFQLCEVATGKALRTFLEPADSVAFSPDGLTAFSARDNTIKLWEVTTGKEIRPFSGHSARVTSVVFSPDGRTALSASVDKTLKLWEVATGKELRTLRGHSGAVYSVRFSRDGFNALSGSKDKTLKLWDMTAL
jgi:WD40 repeat protein